MLDIVLRFFTGIPNREVKHDTHLRINRIENDIGYVYDLRKVACKYLHTTFVIDILSLAPFFAQYYVDNDPNWAWLYYLKVIRLLFSRSINNSVDEIFKVVGHDKANFFMIKLWHNYILIVVIYLKFFLQMHALTCLWIFCGKLEMHDNWMNSLSEKSKGEHGWLVSKAEAIGHPLSFFEAYVEAMSLMTMTISKVGYGVEFAPSAIEKIFLFFVIFSNFNTLVLVFFQVSQLKFSQPLKKFLIDHDKEME